MRVWRRRERAGASGRMRGVVLVVCLLLSGLRVAGATPDPIAFDPSSYTPTSACDGVAYAAQFVAERARAAHPDDDRAALDAFDTAFSTFYIGQPMKTLVDALALARSNGPGPQVQPGSPYFGETGFRAEYLDTGPGSVGKAPTEVDQTHHFAAYLSAGVNGLRLVARLHAAADNDGDARLGAAAFRLGADLAADPGRLATIGDAVREAICDPTTTQGAASPTSLGQRSRPMGQMPAPPA